MNFPDIYSAIEVVSANYRYSKTPDALLVIQELIERFLRFANDLLNMFHIHAPGLTDSRMVSNVMQVALIALGILALIVLLIFVTRQIQQIKLKNDRTKLVGASANVLLTSNDWQEEAERLATTGQWREACRALYFSFLRLLDEREILSFSSTRTNYEYFYALVRKKELAAIFKSLTSLVESAWFGNYRADQKDYERCKQLIAQAIELPDAQAKPTST